MYGVKCIEEMLELLKYNDKQHESILRDYYSRKDLDRYTNKGIYCVLSLLGIYHSDFYVLSDNGTVVGCILVRTKLSKACKRESWIYDVFILQDYRGKGYGKEMMLMAFEKCKYPTVYLNVLKDNNLAINMYKRLGMREIGTTDEEIIMRYDKV